MAIVPQCTLPDHCYTHHGIYQVYFADHSIVNVCNYKLLSFNTTQLCGARLSLPFQFSHVVQEICMHVPFSCTICNSPYIISYFQL